MAKFKFKWNSEKMVSLSAMSISFITLVIFIYQINLMRKQNDLSIMPYLMISTTNDSNDHIFELNIKNHGVGPAIIESVIIEYQDERYDLKDFSYSFFHFLKHKNPSIDSIQNFSNATLDRGMAIPANTTYNLFSIKGSATDYRLITGSLYSLLETGMRYEIIYKSIQGDRWKIFNDSEGPETL